MTYADPGRLDPGQLDSLQVDSLQVDPRRAPRRSDRQCASGASRGVGHAGAAILGLFLSCACSGSVGDPALEAGPGMSGSASANGSASSGPVIAPTGLAVPGSAASGGSSAAPTEPPPVGSAPGASAGVTSVVPFPNAMAFEPQPAMLRRLTRPQFRNSLRDLLGVAVDISDLDTDNWTGNFAVVGASVVSTSDKGVEEFLVAVEGAVDVVFTDSAKARQFLGCTPSGLENDACVEDHIRSFGTRAWRRPLEVAEVERLKAVAVQAATALDDPAEGARWATVAILNSPNFLYRPELGIAGVGGTRLGGYEMASRLAFLIWNSTPDQPLLDEAGGGALDTPEGVRAAATRLLDAPNGREAVAAFAEEFMRLDKVLTQAKDPVLFPEYTPALREAMAREMREIWATVAFDDATSLLDVFITQKTFVNSELAQLYGLDAGGLTPTTFAERALPADANRLGVLARAGFLSQWANQKEGSPTLRGKFLREGLLCLHVPAPPPNTDTQLDDPPEGELQTKRMKLERHREDIACSGCHALMDPLGLPFENFDAIGRYRTTDNTLPVDASGSFNGKDVANAQELGQAIAADTTVAQCLVRKYYSYAVGNVERAEDGTVLNTLTASFAASGYDFRQLVLDLVTSEAFSSVAPQL